MNVEIGAEAAQFPEKEYMNGIAVAVCGRPLEYRDFYTTWRNTPAGSCLIINSLKSFIKCF